MNSRNKLLPMLKCIFAIAIGFATTIDASFAQGSIGSGQIVLPVNAYKGQIIPIQCLGCIHAKNLVDGAGREISMGNFEDASVAQGDVIQMMFIKSPTQVRDWLGIAPLTVGLHRMKFDKAIANFVAYTQFSSRLEVAMVGIMTKTGLPYQNEKVTVKNGICDGPVLLVARQYFFDSDRKPLSHAVVSSVGGDATLKPGDKFPDNYAQVKFTPLSTQAGLAEIPPEHLTVCFGDNLFVANEYFDKLSRDQINEFIRKLEARTNDAAIKSYVEDAVRTYVKDIDKAVVDQTVRNVLVELKKKGVIK